MSSSSTVQLNKPLITKVRQSDWDEWQRLFRAYIAFYQTSLPEEQYAQTFARLLDPQRELHALVLREVQEESTQTETGRLLGLAHFFPHQTPWSEKMTMHFNDLFIDPAVRGKGFGRAMILAVTEHAQEAGCMRVQWVTRHENPARKLYDQLGECDFVQYRRNLKQS